MQSALIKIEDVSVRYGGVRALDGVSLSLGEREIVALMGPNGAGKSTILKSIFGLAEINSGKIIWQDHLIRPLPHEMVRRGIVLVPQGRRVFPSLSVRENLEVGGFMIPDKQELARRIENVLVTFPSLRHRLGASARGLSGGQQQMLALARGLVANPKILLLDEPSLGLAPKIVKEVFDKIKEINQKTGTAILVVEHNIKSLLKIVDRVYVLDKGRVVADGDASILMGSEILKKVFLGELE